MLLLRFCVNKKIYMSSQVERRFGVVLPSERPAALKPSMPFLQGKKVRVLKVVSLDFTTAISYFKIYIFLFLLKLLDEIIFVFKLQDSLPVKSGTKAEHMRECLRSIKRSYLVYGLFSVSQHILLVKNHLSQNIVLMGRAKFNHFIFFLIPSHM